MYEHLGRKLQNYNSILAIEEKMINIKNDINDVRMRSYMAQNLFERSFEFF